MQVFKVQMFQAGIFLLNLFSSSFFKTSDSDSILETVMSTSLYWSVYVSELQDSGSERVKSIDQYLIYKSDCCSLIWNREAWWLHFASANKLRECIYCIYTATVILLYIQSENKVIWAWKLSTRKSFRCSFIWISSQNWQKSHCSTRTRIRNNIHLYFSGTPTDKNLGGGTWSDRGLSYDLYVF